MREGARLRFGASSRVYRAEGGSAPAPAPRHEGGGSRSSDATVAGPQLPGVEPKKRKYTPEDAKRKKVNKWLKGEKSSRQMTENERVAMGAGSGSGCFGPGFD